MIKKRLALIYPATDFDIEHHKFAFPNGLLMLSPVIEKQSVNKVDVFDKRHGLALPEDPNDYDVIGFTSMSMQINLALSMVQQLRAAKFNGKIIFGGVHASVRPEHLKTIPEIDAIFLGEGEYSLPNYLKWLEGDDENNLERTWIRNGSEWKYYDGSNYVENLDDLPFPDRSKFEEVVYKEKFINMFTTRGCPYNCNFCQPTKRLLYGNKIRSRSVDNIVAEIEYHIKKYGITGFSIDDDTFTFNKKIVIDICDRVKPLNLLWSCQSRTDIEDYILEKMKEAGCWLIFVGAESGSQRVLNLMDKHIKIEDNLNFIKRCNKLGIKTFCNIILGYPGETVEDMQLTYDFVMQAQPTRACVSQATPFPGTNLYEKHKDEIIPQDWDNYARHVHAAKFRSMEHLQPTILEYVKKCSIGWDKPLVPEQHIENNNFVGFNIIMQKIKRKVKTLLH